VDLQSSTQHCGECGRACARGRACFQGECALRSIADEDGDRISDFDEGRSQSVDTDGDGTPDFEDQDSDDDGISDLREAGDDDPATLPTDSDHDGTADFRDLDSDNDGLRDRKESEIGTDPRLPDTDGDGETDAVERAGGSDPTDPSQTVRGSGGFVFELPEGASAETDVLTFEPHIQRADVLLLFDTTRSMGDKIDNLQSDLTSLVDSIRTTITDTAFGVARFDDFPVAEYGSGEDRPFTLEQRVTTDDDAIEDAVFALDAPLHQGGDAEESHIEALYQLATGEGFRSPEGDPWVQPFEATQGFDRELGHGTIGGAGFRRDSLPIVMMVTDAGLHRRWEDEPVSSDPATWCGQTDDSNRCDFYDAQYFGSAADQQPKRWETALEELQRIDAVVMGIVAEGQGDVAERRHEVSAFAVRTGGYVAPREGSCPTGLGGSDRPAEQWDPDGPAGPQAEQSLCPLVYTVDSEGSGLDARIESAIDELTTFVSFETIHAEARDDPSTGEVDESALFVGGVPVASDPESCPSAPSVTDRLPASGPDGTFDTFEDVAPGCRVSFRIVARNDGAIPASCEDRAVTMRVLVVGDDTITADARTVVVRVPGENAQCE
jgi:hypothetical protein